MCCMRTQIFPLDEQFPQTRKQILTQSTQSSKVKPFCTILLIRIHPLRGMFGLVSALDLYLTRPLPYQRNRTPAECEAACSARLNPSLSTRSLDVCTAGPAVLSCSTAMG